MNGKVRKVIGLSLAGLGVAALCGVISSAGIVRADVVGQDPIDGDNADTTAEVTMKERCIWYVDGVPSAITLIPTGGSVGEVYDGTQYTLGATLADYTAWTSGNLSGPTPPDSHASCTFFGEQTGIEIDGTWSGTEFSALAKNIDGSGTDADDTVNMGFSADGTDPLTLGVTEGVCRVPGGEGSWDVGPDLVAHSRSTGSVLKLLATDATAIPSDSPGGNDKCNAELSVTASIPASQTPRYAGKAYVFTGPTLTTDISIDTTR